MSPRKTNLSRNLIPVAVSALRRVMTSREVQNRRLLTHSRSRRGNTPISERYRIASSCLAKPSLIAICMGIIRTLQLRRKLRDLTPELLLVALSMGTTTVAATLTRTWSEQMYPWASQPASRTLACFTYHKQVTRQITWFSQLLAFPIMIDHTMSVSSCDFYRLKNFPGKLIWVNFAEFWCFLY